MLRGKNVRDVITNPKIATVFLASIEQAIQSNSLVTIEYQLDEKDLNVIEGRGPKGVQWFEGRIRKLAQKIEGKTAVVWVAVNITQRKIMEAELKRISETDPLTGAYNRRYFIDQVEHQFNYFLRYENENSLIMFDIDHFKLVNDTYGHQAGDEALKEFVRVCKENFRKADIFARYGGEEFMALLPNSPMEGAYQIAERIRSTLETNTIKFKGQSVPFTVSGGIAKMLISDHSFNDSLNRADVTLYKAKKEGRNKIAMDEDED